MDIYPLPGLVVGVRWCVIDLLDQDGEWGRNWVFGASLCPATIPNSCPSFPVLAALVVWGTAVTHPSEDEGVYQPHLLLLCRFAAAPGLRVCTGATEVINHRSSFAALV